MRWPLLWLLLGSGAEDRRTPGGVAEDRRVAEDGEEEEMTLWPVAEAD